MASITTIRDDAGAISLARLLNGHDRTRPVVLVSVPNRERSPWIDADAITREVGALADVYVIENGSQTWTFEQEMPAGTHVYGGAGRVYPVGHAWASDLSESPLRLVFDRAHAERVTADLVSDALRMAAAAGLGHSAPTARERPAAGRVTRVIAGRALVTIDNTMHATIAEELGVPGVPIERLVRPGQHVIGRYDPDSHRLDIRSAIRPASEALAAYRVGDVVLAMVAAIRADSADLLLYPATEEPAVSALVEREAVTTNPLDDLHSLMTLGEVIAGRIVERGARWSLLLSDVDDDEPIVEPPALLPEGPPWLREADLEGVPTAPPREPDAPQASSPVDRPADPGSAPSPRAAAPNPSIFDRRRTAAAPGPVPAATAEDTARASTPPPAPPTPASALEADLRRTVARLTAELAAARRDLAGSRAGDYASPDTRALDQLRAMLEEAERRAARADSEAARARAALRKARGRRTSDAAERPQFADREQGFRHLVLTRWATRIPVAEQAQRPLKPFTLGPQFLESLEELQGIPDEKVADVVVEIATNVAHLNPSREVHQLRTGSGGDDRVRVRKDGAVAWRASLQVRSPSARRIHYWLGPGDSLEFARVAKHDEFVI